VAADTGTRQALTATGVRWVVVGGSEVRIAGLALWVKLKRAAIQRKKYLAKNSLIF